MNPARKNKKSRSRYRPGLGVALGARELSSIMIAMREVRDIYHQGVWAVAAAFRQLYEMIDADEKRVQKLLPQILGQELNRARLWTKRRIRTGIRLIAL